MLVEKHTFEEVAYLLIYGEMAGENFSDALKEMSSWAYVPESVLLTLRAQNKNAHPMGVLQTIVGAFGNSEFASSEIGLDTNPAAGLFNVVDSKYDEAQSKLESMTMVANAGYFVGTIGRWLAGKKPVVRSGFAKSLAGNILHQLKNGKYDDFEEVLMDKVLILYAEHEFNASTLAVRVAASAHTDLVSAIVAGIGTLRGPRHGGANEEAMKLMLRIRDPKSVKKHCDELLNKEGARLPGFGHRIYKKVDPRVKIIKPYVRELSRKNKDMRWFEITLALEEYMSEYAKQKGREIPANIDLWTAPLFYLMGIPLNLYTSLFAASRVAGWCGHYIEVRHIFKEPIIRPRAEYVGI